MFDAGHMRLPLGNHDNRLLDSSSPAQSQALRAILVGGFVVGVLDLGYAILVYSPQKTCSDPSNHR